MVGVPVAETNCDFEVAAAHSGIGSLRLSPPECWWVEFMVPVSSAGSVGLAGLFCHHWKSGNEEDARARASRYITAPPGTGSVLLCITFEESGGRR